jgi:hypothetical protein
MSRIEELPYQNTFLDAEDQMQLLDLPIKAYFSVRHRFPPKNEDDLLDRVSYPESECLPDSSSQPIIQGHVLVNQETSHLPHR